MHMQKITILLLALIPLTNWAAAPEDVQCKLLVDSRTQLQAKFSKLQQALGMDPSKASHEAHANLEAFAKELTKLKDDSVAVLNTRYNYWNNQGYWRMFWDKGPAAKFVVAKLRAQIDVAATAPVPIAGPFTKPDLNSLQKAMDAVRAGFELDRQLQLMETQLNNLPRK